MAQPKQLGVGDDGARPNRGASEVGLGSSVPSAYRDDRAVARDGCGRVHAGRNGERRLEAPSPRQEYQRGHALAVADFNGDGYDEIVGGDQNGGGALILSPLRAELDTWETIDIDRGGVAVIGIDLADINGDGALDIVAIGGASNNVVWYENTP